MKQISTSRLSLVVLSVVTSLCLTACDDPPCVNPDQAAEAYRDCLRLIQQGDGGAACGRKAYRTFCSPNQQNLTLREN